MGIGISCIIAPAFHAKPRSCLRGYSTDECLSERENFAVADYVLKPGSCCWSMVVSLISLPLIEKGIALGVALRFPVIKPIPALCNSVLCVGVQ